ncbi:MAG: hypothetical protein IPJ23_18605 [Ignavibacteriales bacterium]|nr:hypothetical protein [Ignavibacteriales bacterium]
MKIFYVLVPFLLLPVLFSCGHCKPTNENISVDKNINQSGPASIVQNISIVTARVDEVLFKDETDYRIKVTVLVVEESDSHPSIATPGQEYLLTPNFRYDNEVLMKSDVNDSLKKLSKLSRGKEFKAEISLENQKGWFIQKVLSFE